MSKRGKKYRAKAEQVDVVKAYSTDDAFKKLMDVHYATFDETVDVAIRLGVDAKQSDQMVRGAVSMPHGTGKSVRVIVFARGDKLSEAEKAGADLVGGEELVEKIKGGWLDFDSAIATPDMMALVSKVGKILGPKGLMPNPKTGTVTQDVTKAVKEAKAGRVEYRIEKAGIIHASIGKVSFGAEKLRDNFTVLMEALMRAKPSSSKGKYLRTIAVSSTMSPAVRVDVSQFE